MSPSESGQQVSRERFEDLAGCKFGTVAVGDSAWVDLVAYAEQEHAAREAAERDKAEAERKASMARDLHYEALEARDAMRDERNALEAKVAAAEESFHRYEERAHVAEMKLEQVRSVHHREDENGTGYCADDGHVWPCRTIRNLDSPAEGETTE